MISYVIRRLFQMVIVLIGVSIITFIILFAIPGDPAAMVAGKNATPEKIAEIRRASASTSRCRCSTSSTSTASCTATSASPTTCNSPVAEPHQAERARTPSSWPSPPCSSSCSASRWASTRPCASTPFWDTTLTTAALIIWGIPVFVLGLFMQWFFGLKLNLLPLVGAGDNVLGIIPAIVQQLRDPHPAGVHAGHHRGGLHLVHAARLHARGHPHGLRAHGARQGALRAPGRSPGTPSRTP